MCGTFLERQPKEKEGVHIATEVHPTCADVDQYFWKLQFSQRDSETDVTATRRAEGKSRGARRLTLRTGALSMAKRLEKIYNRLVGKDASGESSEEGEVTAGEAGREGDGEVVVEDGGIINLDSDSSEERATRRQGRTGQAKKRRLNSSDSEEDGGNVRGPTLLERGAMEEIRRFRCGWLPYGSCC